MYFFCGRWYLRVNWLSSWENDTNTSSPKTMWCKSRFNKLNITIHLVFTFWNIFLHFVSNNYANFWSSKRQFGDLLKYICRAISRVSILLTISISNRHRIARLFGCTTQCMPSMCDAWETCNLLVTPFLLPCRTKATFAPNAMNQSLIWWGVNWP